MTVAPSACVSRSSVETWTSSTSPVQISIFSLEEPAKIYLVRMEVHQYGAPQRGAIALRRSQYCGPRIYPQQWCAPQWQGSGGLIIHLIAVIVREFLTCLNIPDRHNPDETPELFGVAVWVTRMIDIACRVLAHTPIKGIALIQANNIDIACG